MDMRKNIFLMSFVTSGCTFLILLVLGQDRVRSAGSGCVIQK